MPVSASNTLSLVNVPYKMFNLFKLRVHKYSCLTFTHTTQGQNLPSMEPELTPIRYSAKLTVMPFITVLRRQRRALNSYAKRNVYTLMSEFHRLQLCNIV